MEGSCLCGSVRFEVQPPLRDVLACHCTQCRKTSGHYWGASAVPLERFRLLEDKGLRWYRSSDIATRGFCGVCGSTLFWNPDGQGRMSFSPAALDGPTGLKTTEHWLLEDAGDYYTDPQPGTGTAMGTGTGTEVLTGRCLCGANHFTLPGPMGEVTACHCSQCRKTSGQFAASFDVAESALDWQARQAEEFRTEGGGARGFCTGCGASLYFRAADGSFSVEAGMIENPTGGRLVRHIFVADKGDYYELDDGVPQSAGP